MTSIEQLKERHRSCRDGQDEPLRVRIHRAISWLVRAEQEGGDPDAQFLFLWIALNAAYASEFGYERSEREQGSEFVRKLLALDTQGKLQNALFQQFTGPVRNLIENRFVFEPFWKAARDHDSSGAWETRFAASKRSALLAVMEKRTDVVLSIVLDRLYTLRNQIVHGGSTWNGAANRAQLMDGVLILQTIAPIIVELMIEQGSDTFGPVAYPYLRT